MRPADVFVDRAVLAEHAIPSSDRRTNKHDRGVALLIGGTVETPGAMVLAATAALRAGCGKVQILTVEPAAPMIATALPEARVTGLPTDEGEVHAGSVAHCREQLEGADAVLIGSGCLDPHRTALLRAEVLGRLRPPTVAVVDAAALPNANDAPHALPDPAHTIVMPNPAEAAAMLGRARADVERDVGAAVEDLVGYLGCLVTVRDAETWTSGPADPLFVDESGHPALATAGSGDVFAGLITALAARGASPLAAALWAAHAHGHAGRHAAERAGGDGILARELPREIPAVLTSLMCS